MKLPDNSLISRLAVNHARTYTHIHIHTNTYTQTRKNGKKAFHLLLVTKNRGLFSQHIQELFFKSNSGQLRQ